MKEDQEKHNKERSSEDLKNVCEVIAREGDGERRRTQTESSLHEIEARFKQMQERHEELEAETKIDSREKHTRELQLRQRRDEHAAAQLDTVGCRGEGEVQQKRAGGKERERETHVSTHTSTSHSCVWEGLLLTTPTTQVVCVLHKSNHQLSMAQIKYAI